MRPIDSLQAKLQSCINTGQIRIPRDMRDELVESYGATTVAKTLQGMIQSGTIQFPYKRHYYTDVDVERLFRNLQSYSAQVTHEELNVPNLHFLGSQSSRHVAASAICTYKKHMDDPRVLQNDHIAKQQLCMFTFKSSFPDYFNMDVLTCFFSEEPRMKARRSDEKYSPYEYWCNQEQCTKMLYGMLTRKKWPNNNYENHPAERQQEMLSCAITTHTLREELFACVKEATTFKSSYAASLYRLLAGKRRVSEVSRFNPYHPLEHELHLNKLDCSKMKILDFSAGWGDRLIASMACNVAAYVGCDPNQELVAPHNAIKKRFTNHVDHPNAFTIIPKPFEDVSEQELRDAAGCQDESPFDVIFTSPPFFNFELYCGDNNQSSKRYPEEREWLVHFLFYSLCKSWHLLKIDGRMAIHLTNIYKQQVCLPMLLFMDSFVEGSVYHGIVGNISDLSKRVRPCWLWSKQNPKHSSAYEQQQAIYNLECQFGQELVEQAFVVATKAGVCSLKKLPEKLSPQSVTPTYSSWNNSVTSSASKSTAEPLRKSQRPQIRQTTTQNGTFELNDATRAAISRHTKK